MKTVSIPIEWLNELLALCGPEDHELRERVMVFAAPQAQTGFVTAEAYDRLQALCDSQAARILAFEDAKPVHWRAVLDPEQAPHQLKTSMHAVGFRDQQSAESWIAERLDFDGWRYTLEPLYAAPQAQADARDALTPAARDVLAERARQISSEGWTPERDDEYRGEELALGAAWYATPTFTRNTLDANDMSLWPVSWADSWFKPGDRRRELTKAGALVLAAIERIDRAAIGAAKEGAQHG